MGSNWSVAWDSGLMLKLQDDYFQKEAVKVWDKATKINGVVMAKDVPSVLQSAMGWTPADAQKLLTKYGYGKIGWTQSNFQAMVAKIRLFEYVEDAVKYAKSSIKTKKMIVVS